MRLNRIADNEWELKVTFVKYQFQEQTGTEEIFSKVSEDSIPDQDVLEFIRERYGDGNTVLEFEDSTTQTGN
jgi:hypothetical protein